jgi:acyl-CoA reductase-like NAD-dependent aldehyde dehydrogenase
VLKPSPFTPLSPLRLGEVIAGVLPPGVVSVVSGGDELGAAMTSHPVPRKVTFTGSIAAGKQVASAAGADLKRMTRELGGNDAAVLLDDMDVAATVPAVLARAFFNVGQTCAIPKRIFVPDRLYDEVVDAFVAAAGTIVLGSGDNGNMGPISTRPQYDRVCALMADAARSDARVVTGGRAVEGRGFFVAPTILADAHEGQRIVDEEQFAPVLPLIRYRDVDEAVQRANDTMFGLCGSVWGTDLDRAQAVAERLQCGVTYVNAHGVHLPSMPLLGTKWSGIGVEHGIDGMLEFTDRQVVYRGSAVVSTPLVD